MNLLNDLHILDTMSYTENNPSLLLKAMKTDNYSLAKLLIHNDIRIYEKDNYNNNALIIAIEKDNMEIIELLIEKIDIDEPCYKGHTALTYSAKLGNKKLVEYFLNLGANKEHLTINGSNALIYGAISGNIEIVNLLIDEFTKYIKNNDGYDALLYASELGHLDIVKYLLEHGANINVMNNKGKSPLYLACQNGHKDVVDYLFNCGKSIDYKLNYFLNKKTIRELNDRNKWNEILDNIAKNLNNIAI